MDFYKKISQRIEDLILAVVALGILVVSIEYAQYYLDHQNSIDLPLFFQRLFLFMTVVVFTSYYFIAYTAYFNTAKTENQFKPYSPRKIIALYLNDLAQVMVASWLYAALLIGNLTSAPDNSQPGTLNLSINLMQMMFSTMLVWHLIVLAWYFIADGANRCKLIHACYTALYSLILLIIYLIPKTMISEFVYIWGLLITYLLIVISLYYFKGAHDIKAAINSHYSE